MKVLLGAGDCGRVAAPPEQPLRPGNQTLPGEGAK
jgi:hypothetical protein